MPTIINLATLTSEEGFTISGAGSPGSAPMPMTTDRAGRSVSSAGDVNGDGIDDFIIGAPFFDAAVPNPLPGPVPGEDAGAAYIIYGRLGATRGDINLANLAASEGFRIDGEAKNHYAGTSVSAAGDINGDGIDDFIVGARYGSDTLGGFEGRAYVIYGKTGIRGNLKLANLTAAEGFSIQGDQTFDQIGTAVSAAGDINGDGFDDIVLGASQGESSGAFFQGGEVYVIFGRGGTARSNIDLTNFSNTDGFLISGNVIGRYVGLSVAGAGDVNGDGLDDILFGSLLGGLASSYATSASQAFIVYGQTGATRANIDLRFLGASEGFSVLGADSGDRTGYSVSSAGDINGDGIDDIVIGAPRSSNGVSNAGQIYIVYGQTSPRGRLSLSNFTATQGFIIQGASAGDQAGFAVASAGDVNGDGLNDIIIGAPSSDSVAIDAGEAYVIFGKVGGLRSNVDLSTLSASDGFIIRGKSLYGTAGQSVSSAGDINGDGFADLIVGAPRGGLPAVTGEAFIIYGNANLSPPIPVTGTAGADILINPAGRNAIDGLSGFDTLDMSAFTSAITLNTITGTIVSNQGGSDTVANVEAFVLGSGDDIVLLSSAGFTVRAGSGNDQVTGGAGNDIIEGGAGDDVLDGGAGIDTVSYASSQFGVTVHLDNLTAQNTVQQGIDTISGFENILGSGADDVLFGDAASNVITAGGGFDTLVSGGGTNTLIGGTGGDIYFVQGVNDIVTEGVGGGYDIVLSQVNFSLAAGSEVEALAVNTTAGISLTGNEFGQNLTGNAGNDTLSGGGGNDLIISGGGTNTLIGGTGADIYYAQGLNDVVTEGAGGGFDVVLAGGNLTLAAGSEVEVIAVNTASGVTIIGSDIVQTILGGAGNDRISGGRGNDTLVGSGGADTFVLLNTFADRDFVLDFASGTDKLEISAALFGGGLAAGVLSASQFLSGAGTDIAATAAQRFIYNSSTGNLWFDADGNGAGASVLMANLSSVPTLTAADFLIAA